MSSENPNNRSISSISQMGNEDFADKRRQSDLMNTSKEVINTTGRKKGFTLLDFSSILSLITKSEKETKADTDTSYGSIEVEFRSKSVLKEDIWSDYDPSTFSSSSQTNKSARKDPRITVTADFDRKMANRYSNQISYDDTPDLDNLTRRASNISELNLSSFEAMSSMDDRR